MWRFGGTFIDGLYRFHCFEMEMCGVVLMKHNKNGVSRRYMSVYVCLGGDDLTLYQLVK